MKYTDIQAVITIEQMKKLDFRVKRMSEMYNVYYKELKDYIKMLPPLFEGWHPWFIDIYCPSNRFRSDLIFYLKEIIFILSTKIIISIHIIIITIKIT